MSVISLFGWAALGLLLAYLALFFWGTMRTARLAGRKVWLFGQAKGRDRWAALGFRAAFAIAYFGPLVWLSLPTLRGADPLWALFRLPAFGLLLSFSGALVALVAQFSMGASWRVGISAGETGRLVSTGIFRFSRNPTFVGQFLLLAGVFLAVPALPTLLAAGLFMWSAYAQVSSEEAELRKSLGPEYDAYAARVPRWLGVVRNRAR
tara:strand:+ start:138 stop:758 length:621 start_codon:yes stop_codon:yes gene_type:complete